MFLIIFNLLIVFSSSALSLKVTSIFPRYGSTGGAVRVTILGTGTVKNNWLIFMCVLNSIFLVNFQVFRKVNQIMQVEQILKKSKYFLSIHTESTYVMLVKMEVPTQGLFATQGKRVSLKHLSKKLYDFQNNVLAFTTHKYLFFLSSF